MLEILILFYLCKQIGHRADERKVPRTRYQILVVVLWFTGEMVGAIFGALLGAQGAGLYLPAILGGVGGVIVAFSLVRPPAPAPRGFAVLPVQTPREPE